MTSTTSYLEQYLDSLENLPTELKKNFNNMHDLDSSNKDILVEIDTASDEYLRKVRDLSPGKRKAEMEKIQVKIHRCANDGLIEGNFTWIFKFQSAAFNLVIWRKYEGNKPHFIFKIILKRNIKPPPVCLCKYYFISQHTIFTLEI